MIFHAMLLSLSVLAGPAHVSAPSQPTQLILVANDDAVGPTFLRKIPLVKDLFGYDASGTTEDASQTGTASPPIDESYYEPEPLTAPPPGKPAAAKPATATKKTTTPVTALSCEKATLVVSGFGFSSVEAASCSGRIYAFNARRDGKAFAIKLDSSSGELTEVRKLP